MCGMAVTSQRCIVVEWAFVVCRVLGEYECFGYLGCLLFVMSPSCAPLFLFFIPIKSSEPPTLRSFSFGLGLTHARYRARTDPHKPLQNTHTLTRRCIICVLSGGGTNRPR